MHPAPQAGRVKYPQFVGLTMAAGCVSGLCDVLFFLRSVRQPLADVQSGAAGQAMIA